MKKAEVRDFVKKFKIKKILRQKNSINFGLF